MHDVMPMRALLGRTRRDIFTHASGLLKENQLMTKPFLFLVGVVAVLGVGLGLAFIGGLAVGAGRAEATTPVQVSPAFSPGGSQSGGAGQSAALQQRIQGAGSIDQSAAGPGRQFQRPDEAMPPLDFMAGRAGLMGTVTGIDGDILTIETSQGMVLAVIGENTSITRIDPATAADLEDGLAVRVMVREADSETRVALSITIVPEGELSARDLGSFELGESPRGRMGP
jgi:hypothetical protein